MPILNEINTPIELKFRELLSNSKKMVSDEYPDHIFYFDKEFTGYLNFVLDYELNNFYISDGLIYVFMSVYKLKSQYEVFSELDDLLEELFEGFVFVEFFKQEREEYEELYSNKKLKKWTKRK